MVQSPSTGARRAPHSLGARLRRLGGAARRRVRRLYRDGSPSDQWCRVVMNGHIAAYLTGLGPRDLTAIEISGDTHAGFGWKAYRPSRYAELDICDPPADLDQYDVVICEQVLEHVDDPLRAARTLHDLCRPGGHVVVSTPFMIRVHPTPADHWRFTESGLRLLLERAGLEVSRTGAWGSKAAVRGNLRRFPPARPWRSLRCEPEFPLVVWAFARRPGAG
jgi:SAM-dependent methyltransferase